MVLASGASSTGIQLKCIRSTTTSHRMLPMRNALTRPRRTQTACAKRGCDWWYCCFGHQTSLFQKKLYLLEKPLAGGLMLQKKMILAVKWNESGARNAGSH